MRARTVLTSTGASSATAAIRKATMLVRAEGSVPNMQASTLCAHAHAHTQEARESNERASHELQQGGRRATKQKGATDSTLSYARV